MEEEERPLMPRTDNRSGGEERPQRRVTLRGALGVFFCALVLFVLSSLVSRSFFYSLTSDREESVAFDTTDLKGNLISPRNGSHPTLTSTSECTTSGLPVLAGADVVEYFSMPQGNTPVIADGEIRSTYKDNLFFFRTANNRRTFEANPDKFIPAWGGFCSYGIAAEKVWTDKTLGPFGDPSKWRILSDGRLHVFRSETPLRKFLQQPDSYSEAGNKRWNAWFGGGPEPLNTACFCSDAICNDD